MNLVWRHGFGSKHVTLENLLTKFAYMVSFLNCKRRKIILPHGTLLVNQFSYVPYTVLDDMDIVVNEAEKSLGLWLHVLP